MAPQTDPYETMEDAALIIRGVLMLLQLATSLPFLYVASNNNLTVTIPQKITRWYIAITMLECVAYTLIWLITISAYTSLPLCKTFYFIGALQFATQGLFILAVAILPIFFKSAAMKHVHPDMTCSWWVFMLTIVICGLSATTAYYNIYADVNIIMVSNDDDPKSQKGICKMEPSIHTTKVITATVIAVGVAPAVVGWIAMVVRVVLKRYHLLAASTIVMTTYTLLKLPLMIVILVVLPDEVQPRLFEDGEVVENGRIAVVILSWFELALTPILLLVLPTDYNRAMQGLQKIESGEGNENDMVNVGEGGIEEGIQNDVDEGMEEGIKKRGVEEGMEGVEGVMDGMKKSMVNVMECMKALKGMDGMESVMAGMIQGMENIIEGMKGLESVMAGMKRGMAKKGTEKMGTEKMEGMGENGKTVEGEAENTRQQHPGTSIADEGDNLDNLASMICNW